LNFNCHLTPFTKKKTHFYKKKEVKNYNNKKLLCLDAEERFKHLLCKAQEEDVRPSVRKDKKSLVIK